MTKRVEAGMKWCSGHKAALPISVFSSRAVGQCKECQQKTNRLYHAKRLPKTKKEI